MNWKAKLALLAELVGNKLDEGCRPYQTIAAMFGFRDAMAHGKHFEKQDTFVVEGSMTDDPPKPPAPQWTKAVNMENAQRFSEDAMDMIERLNQAAFGEVAVWASGGSSWQGTLMDSQVVGLHPAPEGDMPNGEGE